jgi:hypothetical protein
VTAGELRDRWERALDDGEPWLPAETGDELLTRITFDPGISLADQPWSSPAVWAAMTCTGA